MFSQLFTARLKSCPDTKRIYETYLNKHHSRTRSEPLRRRKRQTDRVQAIDYRQRLRAQWPCAIGLKFRFFGDLKGFADIFGAEEGTRTPTPLRVRGPEPRASANSATSARYTSSAVSAKPAASPSLANAEPGVKFQAANPPAHNPRSASIECLESAIFTCCVEVFSSRFRSRQEEQAWARADRNNNEALHPQS